MSQQPQPQQHNKWEADKMLDVYVYDYLAKRGFYNSAKAFQQEAPVSTDPVAIDAPGGFLFEWWSVFSDIFTARSSDKNSEAAVSYLETQRIKDQEQRLQSHQLQMQQLLMQGHVQGLQQHGQAGHQSPNGNSSGLGINNSLMMQSPGIGNEFPTKVYEDPPKLLHQREALVDATLLKRFGENTSQFLYPNNHSVLKSSGVGSPTPRQTLVGVPGGISGNQVQVQNWCQQVPGSTQDFRPEMNPTTNSFTFGAAQEGPFMGVNGSNQGGSNIPLKGLPLMAVDHLRSGLLQPKSLIQVPQSNQLHLQKQLLLQTPKNVIPPSSGDIDNRKHRMLLNQRQGFNRDVNPVSDALSNGGSPLQPGSLGISHGDDILMKSPQQQLQGNNQLPQQNIQHQLSSQPSRTSYRRIPQLEKIIGGIMTDGSMSNMSRGNGQVSKLQSTKKRKHQGFSSGPANSSATANNTEPSPCSMPSTSATHTPGGGLPTPNPHGPTNGATSNLPAAPNQLAEIDDFINEEALDDIILPDNGEPIDATGCLDSKSNEGSMLSEVRALSADSEVVCCHFSSDGKLLVTGGSDKKVVLWCADTFTIKSTLEEHGGVITDARFSPTMPRIATSSGDHTVRVWDAYNPGYSLQTFSGHSTTVTSVDFHPCKDDIVCSADASGEIRYWSIANGSCCKVFKAGVTHIRFQPCHGKFLAGAADNIVSIFDIETQVCRVKSQGHKNRITSLCWDLSGELLASVSEEVVKVWSFSAGKGECVHELNCSGSEFQTCIFHPTSSMFIIIGCYKSLEIWNMSEKQTRTLKADTEVISSLAGSKGGGGVVASASHDKSIKIWK